MRVEEPSLWISLWETLEISTPVFLSIFIGVFSDFGIILERQNLLSGF